jgi:hypothetical protein
VSFKSIVLPFAVERAGGLGIAPDRPVQRRLVMEVSTPRGEGEMRPGREFPWSDLVPVSPGDRRAWDNHRIDRARHAATTAGKPVTRQAHDKDEPMS